MLRRNAAVFDALDELADIASSNAAGLRNLSTPNAAEQIESARLADTKAKRLLSRIGRRLAHAFEPPVEAEDIRLLANELREVIELISTLADCLRVYKAEAVSREMLHQITLLSDALATINTRIHALRTHRREADASTAAAEVGELRVQAEHDRDAATWRLYDGSVDPVLVLEATELLELAQTALRACDRIAHTLERISVRHA